MNQEIPGFPTQLYNPDVRFTAEPVCNGENYKQCEGCHNNSSATELTLPNTLYFNGNDLTTRYYRIWFCPDCIRKLKQALECVESKIIRCAECKNWHINCLESAGRHGCDVVADYTGPDYYCARAERRQTDDDPN